MMKLKTKSFRKRSTEYHDQHTDQQREGHVLFVGVKTSGM